MNFITIRKRNGTTVPFDPTKITSAVSKAFYKITGDANSVVSEQIKESTMQKLHELHKDEDSGIPYVEQIQDLVEQSIMEAGYFDVAKHYILYRHEKIKERAQKKQIEIQKIEEGNASICRKDDSWLREKCVYRSNYCSSKNGNL
jgi:ribonucleoside-diphosphate reductase alpha chain